MQKQSQAAIFIFNRVGCPHSLTLPHQTSLIFSQIVLGRLFVQGYRIFSKNTTTLCLTYVRRMKKNSEYLFLKFLDQNGEGSREEVKKINETVNLVRKIKGISNKQILQYKVIAACLHSKNIVQFTNEEFQELQKSQGKIKSRGENSKKEGESLKKKEVSEESECQDLGDGSQLDKIKTFVWAYLDTFGQKYKDNLYHQFQRESKSHLSIQRIIDTVNWIIYCETVGKPFNQLQSSNWTCFEAQSKQKCKVDRKQIVFTGSGTILYVPLLFICQKLENYRNECQRQLNEVIHESKKYYSQGQIKAYLITDHIDYEGLIYRTQSSSLQSFPDKKHSIF